MANKESDTASKIQKAIQEKLQTIDPFLDNSLPEYVMILIANQRSKTQMEKDLSLFLGSETNAFTNWLWDSLKGFNKDEKQPEQNVETKSKTRTEDNDVLNYNPLEQEELYQDEESDGKKNSSQSYVKSEIKVSTDNPPAPLHTKQSVIPIQKSAKVYPIQKVTRTAPVKSKVQSLIRPSLRPAISPDDEYDPTRPGLTGGVSSVVRVTSRKHEGTAALQANKLLQRAVTEANKSVLNQKSARESYKPSPISVQPQEVTESIPQPIKLNSTNPVSLVSPSVGVLHNVLKEPYIVYENNNLPPSVNIYAQENYILTNDSKSNRTICMPPSPIVNDTEVCDEALEYCLSPTEKNPRSPHFFVTLDGVDFTTFKRKHSESDDGEEPMDTEEYPYDETPEKKQRKNERCKYWPACKNSDTCLFYHPTVSCKKFPDCAFGDKCLYIHPNCKFDALCTRKDCPFTHASKRSLKPPPARAKRVHPSKIPCKFYPNCVSVPCPYIHPKVCRFGTKCRAPGCAFIHVPSRKELSWTASV